jgi:hypothetical protein
LEIDINVSEECAASSYTVEMVRTLRTQAALRPAPSAEKCDLDAAAVKYPFI